MLRAFISHASKDKEGYVRVIAKRLGKDQIIVDEFDFEVGGKTIDEIVGHLNKTSLFVLLISNAALDSEWVQKEMFLAKEKLFQGSLEKFYPVIIDSSINHKDERIPDWIRNNYNIKYLARPSVASRRIHQKLREISWSKHPELKARKTYFVGRTDKLSIFERRLNDFDQHKPKCVIACGVPSIGRRTFLRNALIKTDVIESFHFPSVIYMERNDSIEDFIVKVVDLGISSLDVTQVDFLNTSLVEKKSIVSDLLLEIYKAKEHLFILDDGAIIGFNKEPIGWFDEVLSSVNLPNFPIISIASKYRVKQRSIRNKEHFFSIDISELDFLDRKGLFAKLTELYEIDISRDDFTFFCDLFHGFPDQIIFCVEMIKDLGVRKSKSDAHLITEYNSEKASILIRRHEDDPEKLDFIRLLAQFEIISLDFLFDIVNEEVFYPIIEDLVSENICEFVTPEADMLRLIDIVRDYIKRNRLNISDRYSDKIRSHVERFLVDEDVANRDASDYIYSLKEALISGKKVDPSKLMPSHFLRCMKDLYQQRRSLTKLVSLADQVLAKEQYLDNRVAQDIRYYLCLALARSKDQRVLKEVQSIKGDEHSFILGYYYRLVGRHKDAIERLTSILEAPYVGQRASRELVQVYLQTESYEQALNLAKNNYEHNRGNQYHIQAYFHCLINSNLFYEQKDILYRLVKELEAIGSQLSLQMAVIADAEYCDRCENDGIRALDKINDVIASYPDITYPLLTKFDIALRRKNIDEMESAHTGLQELSKRISTSIFSLEKQKAYLEAAKGNVETAMQILIPAMRKYPETAKQKAEATIRELAKNIGSGLNP